MTQDLKNKVKAICNLHGLQYAENSKGLPYMVDPKTGKKSIIMNSQQNIFFTKGPKDIFSKRENVEVFHKESMIMKAIAKKAGGLSWLFENLAQPVTTQNVNKIMVSAINTMTPRELLLTPKFIKIRKYLRVAKRLELEPKF